MIFKESLRSIPTCSCDRIYKSRRAIFSY